MPGEHVKGPENPVLVERMPHGGGRIYVVDFPWLYGHDRAVPSHTLRLARRHALRCR